MVLAEQIQVVLVLCDDAVIDLEDLDEPVKDVALSEGLAVDKQQSCIEVEVAVQTKALLDVGAVLVYLHHRLLMAGSEDEVCDVCIVELRHVALDDGVAVDVDGLVILRMHVCDEEPEICGL